MNKQIIELDENRKLKIVDYPGGSQTIIALHGLTGNNLQLQFYISLLTPKYHVIAVDFRGRGDSGNADDQSSLWKHAKDIKDLIAKLEIEDVILMGYSMGGFVSAIVASEINPRALILLDGAGEMFDHQRSIVEPTFSRISSHYNSMEEYVESTVAKYKNMGIDDSEELRNAVKYEIACKGDYWQNKSCEKTIRQDWESFWKFDIKELADKITCPVLLVEATGGIGGPLPLFKPESYVLLKKHIKNLVNKVSDASHYTMVFTERSDINNFILDFLLKI